jgi:DNA-binding cell septation regulator SpoVG
MEITEVRIKLMEDSDDRLQAFCSITFDNCFVVRDLKIIDGTNGPFVAMPSRKLTRHCHQCGSKNHLKAQYCNQCGARQHEDRALRDAEGRAKLYADIAHPINSQCREMIQYPRHRRVPGGAGALASAGLRLAVRRRLRRRRRHEHARAPRGGAAGASPAMPPGSPCSAATAKPSAAAHHAEQGTRARQRSFGWAAFRRAIAGP